MTERRICGQKRRDQTLAILGQLPEPSLDLLQEREWAQVNAHLKRQTGVVQVPPDFEVEVGNLPQFRRVDQVFADPEEGLVAVHLDLGGADLPGITEPLEPDLDTDSLLRKIESRTVDFNFRNRHCCHWPTLLFLMFGWRWRCPPHTVGVLRELGPGSIWERQGWESR